MVDINEYVRFRLNRLDMVRGHWRATASLAIFGGFRGNANARRLSRFVWIDL